jgi:hypothetical protein
VERNIGHRHNMDRYFVVGRYMDYCNFLKPAVGIGKGWERDIVWFEECNSKSLVHIVEFDESELEGSRFFLGSYP